MIHVSDEARSFVENSEEEILWYFEEYPEQALELRDALIEEFEKGVKALFKSWREQRDAED